MFKRFINYLKYLFSKKCVVCRKYNIIYKEDKLCAKCKINEDYRLNQDYIIEAGDERLMKN